MTPIAELVWGPDPVLFRWGPLVVRWYSILFAAGFLGGYALWSAQMRRLGASTDRIALLLPWAFLAVLAGARLGYCLLYEPGTYLAAPWRMLQVRQGGLASHGAAVGLLLALFVYARRMGFRVGEVMDRASPSVALAAGMVRIGNLLNSEIVGVPSSAPWAFRFLRGVDGGAVPRHPVQLYEAALAFAVLGVLLAVDRALGARRPRWLLTGLLFALYFGGRIWIESLKDSPRLGPLLHLTTGQALSLPFALAGLVLIASAATSRRSREDTDVDPATGR